ncbi:MAG: hypothetical protein M1827_007722 [Pycnora praestabilis]|nr:MAG: hypothetical protein M1827_007722 [Pycnora praestabilis]
MSGFTPLNSRQNDGDNQADIVPKVQSCMRNGNRLQPPPTTPKPRKKPARTQLGGGAVPLDTSVRREIPTKNQLVTPRVFSIKRFRAKAGKGMTKARRITDGMSELNAIIASDEAKIRNQKPRILGGHEFDEPEALVHAISHDEVRISNQAMSKLDAFRYQAKPAIEVLEAPSQSTPSTKSMLEGSSQMMVPSVDLRHESNLESVQIEARLSTPRSSPQLAPDLSTRQEFEDVLCLEHVDGTINNEDYQSVFHARRNSEQGHSVMDFVEEEISTTLNTHLGHCFTEHVESSARAPIHWRTSSPLLGVTDLDDEFPMDLQDTNLTDMTIVEERFSPPSSLQYPFDDNSQTNEIYNDNLEGFGIHLSNILPPNRNLGTDTEISQISIYEDPIFVTRDTSHEGGIGEGVRFDDDNEDACKAVGENWTFLNEDEENEPIDFTNSRYSPLGPVDPNVAHLQRPNQQTDRRDIIGLETPGSRTPMSTLVRQLLDLDVDNNPKPFVRLKIPNSVRDCSPVMGLSSKKVLRTCFRIGEALNQGCTAARLKKDVIIELYARVTFSEREVHGSKQFFQFSDLFHDRPPFLNGVYQGWKGVDLWDKDSRIFLGEAGKCKMCRCLGRIKRDQQGTNGWKMEIMSIFEADWDDVAYVKGIVDA